LNFTPPGGSNSTKKPAARLKVATLHGVPVFIHWSLPFVGLLISAATGFNLAETLYYSLAYAFLLFIHEVGHMAAARLLGLHVFAIDIAGFGATCTVQAPRAVRAILFVFSAGMLAQLTLLLLTLVILAIAGAPSGALGRCVAVTFTYGNVALLIFSLLPWTTPEGIQSDGRVLWRVILHAIKGTPHPFPDPIATTRIFPPETSLLQLEGFAPPGFHTGIEILNDEKTPMQFVVDALTKHLQLDLQAAVDLMLRIHNTGGALVPMEDEGRARALADAVTSEAQAQGHPLVFRWAAVPQPGLPDAKTEEHSKQL
jgi:ATP-dependent Clp protease adapter protein ClpS